MRTMQETADESRSQLPTFFDLRIPRNKNESMMGGVKCHTLPPPKRKPNNGDLCLQVFAVTSSVVNDDAGRHRGGEDADVESYDSQDRENLSNRRSLNALCPFSPGLVTSSVSQQAEQGSNRK